MTESDEKKHEIIEAEVVRRVEAEVVDESEGPRTTRNRHQNANSGFGQYENVRVFQFGTLGAGIPLWKKLIWSIAGFAILAGIIALIGSFVLVAIVTGGLYFFFHRVFRSRLIAALAVFGILYGWHSLRHDAKTTAQPETHFGVPKND